MPAPAPRSTSTARSSESGAAKGHRARLYSNSDRRLRADAHRLQRRMGGSRIRAKRLLVTGRHGFVGGVACPRDRDRSGAGRMAADRHAGNLGPARSRRHLGDRRGSRARCGVAPRRAELGPGGLPRSGRRRWTSTCSARCTCSRRCRARGSGAGWCYVGTGDVYGRVPEDALPVTEARLPAPTQSLRGQQARRRSAVLAVDRHRGPRYRADAAVQPHRGGAERPVRRVGFRAPGGGDQAAAGASRWSPSATSTSRATSPTSATSCGRISRCCARA